MEHRWSGWPGAWCHDCGAEDIRESCLAGNCGKTHIVSGLDPKDPDFVFTPAICENPPCPHNPDNE